MESGVRFSAETHGAVVRSATGAGAVVSVSDSGSISKQRQRQFAASESSVRGSSCDGLDTITSGSFKWLWVAGEDSDVKGKTSRFATLDIGILTGCGRGMNDPEVTMLEALPSNNLIAHSTALEAASLTLALVRRVPSPFRSLADQVIRAASSVAANLSEGHGRFGRDRFNHWRIAYGSAKEVDTFLRLLAGAGVVDKDQTATALELFDQVRAMTWRLLHPKE